MEYQNRNYINSIFLFAMGCQCSQANSIAQQQPHIIDQKVPRPKPEQPVPQVFQQKAKLPELIINRDKQNQKPKGLIQNNFAKSPGDKQLITQPKESEQTKEPLIDLGQKIQATSELNQANKLENSLAAKSQNKIVNEALMGPSSKSIEFEQPAKEQSKQKEAYKNSIQLIKVQDLPANNEQKMLSYSKKELSSKKKLKSVKSVRQETQKSIKVQLNTFILQQWQSKGKEEQPNRTEKLLKVDETLIERQEISHYLNAVRNYEKQVLNSLIEKLQLKEHNKFQQSVLAAK